MITEIEELRLLISTCITQGYMVETPIVYVLLREEKDWRQ